MRLVVPLLAASVAGFGVLPPPAKPSLAKIAAHANTCVYRLSPYLVDALGGCFAPLGVIVMPTLQ